MHRHLAKWLVAVHSIKYLVARSCGCCWPSGPNVIIINITYNIIIIIIEKRIYISNVCINNIKSHISANQWQQTHSLALYTSSYINPVSFCYTSTGHAYRCVTRMLEYINIVRWFALEIHTNICSMFMLCSASI